MPPPTRRYRQSLSGFDIPRDVVSEHQIWESNPQFGQNVIVEAREAPQLVSVLTHEEHGSPRMWTIALGIDYNTDPRLWVGRGPGTDEIRGLITFGSGAGISMVEFDWTQGLQISLPANTLKITAQVPGSLTSRMPATQCLSAVLGPGTRARGLPPVWSRALPEAAGSSPIYPIPPYAARVWISSLEPDLAVPGASIELYGDPEATLLLQRAPLAAAGAPGFHILGGARFARVVTPVALSGARIAFELRV